MSSVQHEWYKFRGFTANKNLLQWNLISVISLISTKSLLKKSRSSGKCSYDVAGTIIFFSKKSNAFNKEKASKTYSVFFPTKKMQTLQKILNNHKTKKNFQKKCHEGTVLNSLYAQQWMRKENWKFLWTNHKHLTQNNQTMIIRPDVFEISDLWNQQNIWHITAFWLGTVCFLTWMDYTSGALSI